MATSPKSPDAVLSAFRSAQLNPDLQELTRTRLIARHSGDRAQDDPALPDRRLAVARVTDEGLSLLVVDGEIVVRVEDAERAAPVVKEHGFGGPETVRCAGDCDPPGGLPIVIFRRRGATPDQIRDTLDALAKERINASFNHVLPDGPAKNGLTGAAALDDPSQVPTFPAKHVDPSAGEGVIVAVIDTGIAEFEDPRADRILDGIVPTADNVDRLNAINLREVPPHDALDLGAGHGTFVAGVVRQVAPAADVRVYRALNSDGIGSEVGVACAILRAWRDGANIINLSLGSESYRDRPPVALEAALAMLPDDVIVVAAAGNLEREVTAYEATRPHWPAAFRRVVAVAALEQDYTPARWSQRGHWVDVSTWGENVTSTYVIGYEEATAENQDPDDWRNAGASPWALWSGTSFAAPQVAGMIAAATPRTSPAQRADPRTGLAAVMAGSSWSINWFGSVLRSPLN
jgi:hypothetical protein